MALGNLSNRSSADIWARGGGSYSTTSSSLSVSAAPLTPLGDAADFNASFQWQTNLGLANHVTDYIGDKLRDKIVLPQGDNVPGTVRWQLDSGLAQDTSDNIITFGFLDQRHATGLTNNPSFGEGFGYSPFSAAQIAAARIAIGNWDDLIAPHFVEQSPLPGSSAWAQNTTDIWLSNTTTGPAQAWAYYPGYGNQYTRIAGDVFIADPDFNSSNNQLYPGGYGLQTLNHELGHAIGLSHPGNYNFGDDTDGDGEPDPINYTGDAQYFQDGHQFTIMSYFDSYETGAQNVDWNVMRFIYPSTPMVDDVFVIQQKYGADMTTRTGNSTYGFNASSDVTNEAMRFHANEMFTIFTIWDAGGTDTLNLSGYYTDSYIDLREGAYSSAGGAGAYSAALAGDQLTLAQINANNAAAGLGARNARLYEIYFNGDYSDTNADGTTTLVNEGLSWREITGTGDEFLMEQNIGIAYGTVIENAVGGYGDDVLIGNQANNTLTGGAGADRFVFADDGSQDTITDFRTGVDHIDLSELNVTRRDVTFNAATDTLYINTDGLAGYDMSIIVHGQDVNIARDILFG
jgi:serralysin